MNGYIHPSTQFELGKHKMQASLQEQENLRLARQARRVQPVQIKATMNQVFSFFKPLMLTLKKYGAFRQSLQEQSNLRLQEQTLEATVNHLSVR